MPYKVGWFDWLLLAGLVICWGSSFAMTKIAVGHLDPTWITALRLIFGALFLLIVAIATRQLPGLGPRTWFKYLWLGFIGNALPFFLITWGVQFVSSGVSGLMMGFIPILILLLAHFFLPGERLNAFKIAGFALGFAGLTILIDPRNIGNFSFSGGALVGELAILLACVAYAVNSITTKRMGFDNPIAQSFGVLLCAALLALIPALALAPINAEVIPGYVWWAAIGLGIFPTGIATVLFFKLVERTSPTMVAQSNYLVPVYALVFGAVLLGEKLGLNVLIALVFILSGIFVSRMTQLRLLPSK